MANQSKTSEPLDPAGGTKADFRTLTTCQARGCTDAPEHGVLLRLDPRRAGGLEVFVCDDHRKKLEQLGAKTRDEDGLGIDQDDEPTEEL